MNETLDFFSNSGKPLRATVALQISKQEIRVPAVEGSPGTSEQHLVEDGETLQQAAAAAGRDDWQGVAAANGVENPRRMSAGALVDLRAGVSVSAGASGGASTGGAAGVSGGGGLSIGAANNLSLAVSGGLGFGASSRTSLSGGFGAGASASAGASTSGGSAAGASTSVGSGTRIR
jgi:hypothetical protein